MKGQKRQTGQTYKKVGDSPNEPPLDQIIKAHETLYLIKWLFPQTINKSYQAKLQQFRRGNFPSFQSHYLNQSTSPSQVPAVGGSSHNASQNGGSSSYWDRFEIVDDIDDSDGEEFGEESEDDDIDMKDL